jgi:hypothetical protein
VHQASEGRLRRAGLRRLRDDRGTGRSIWRVLVSAGNFMNDGPWAVVPWTVTFARIGRAQYIVSEHALLPLHVEGVTYRVVSVSFEQIATVPGTSFSLPATFIAPHELLEPSD